MIKPIPKGIDYSHVLKAAAEIDAEAVHSFHDARKWAILIEGRRYAPKPLIGLAAQHAFGKRLEPSDFSSGEGVCQAVGYLRRLGFEAVRFAEGGEAPPQKEDGPMAFSSAAGIRLLVISCGESKRHDAGLLPAIERYDGPKFRTLRKHYRERQDSGLSTYILSAKFGLIRSDERIPWYDQQMTPGRAAELREPTRSKLRRLVKDIAPTEVFVYAAIEYRDVLEPLDFLPCSVTRAEGNQGKKRAHLKRWLASDPGS